MYAAPKNFTEPSQNSGSSLYSDADKTPEKLMDSLNCTLDLFEDFLLKTLNSSNVELDALNEKLASCNETGSIEARDK